MAPEFLFFKRSTLQSCFKMQMTLGGWKRLTSQCGSLSKQRPLKPKRFTGGGGEASWGLTVLPRPGQRVNALSQEC